eukprot:gene33780-41670_t
MEPWRDNYVSIDGIDSSCSNTWKLTGKGQIADQEFSGQINSDATFTAVPKETGFYNLKVTSKELSTLTDTDREEFLDALRTLWDVDTLTGQKLYGEKYKSLYYFATIHNDGGANPICDEFHRNTGFINNHVYLGAFLEQSLQLVNPRTALHYWEYTKDFSSDDLNKHVVNQLDGGAWSEIMTAKYFGTSDPITGEVMDGRWAHNPMPRLTAEFFTAHGVDETKTFYPSEDSVWTKYSPAHIASPYGLLRGPWNFSPSTFVMRFNNAMQIANAESANSLTFKPYSGSTCSDYKQFIENFVVGQPLYSYLLYADAQIHGYVHYTTGGASGNYALTVDKKLRSDFGFTDDDIATISVASARFFKTWISMSVMPLPEFVISPVVCTGTDRWNPTTHTLTSDAAPGETDGPARMQIDGDMAGSGSATDPLFWVAHGA